MPNEPRRSILCPNCNKLVSADERFCPHCGISSPGAWWKNNLLTRRFLRAEQVIQTLVYVNAGMYLISLVLNPSNLTLSPNPFNFLSPGNKTLLLLGATGSIPIDLWHRWWTVVSANYLHGGILHILFNMLALWQIGPLVVREYGVHRMVTLYTLGGVIGFLVSYLAGVRLTLGASAAVCSLIGASLYYGKSRGGIYGQAVYRQIGGWVVALFVFGLLVPGIDNWGHGGGIGAGIMLGFLLGYAERKRENIFHKGLAAACVFLTITVLVWAVASSCYYRLLG
ncbi:MAG: rhomboid family intramembrane serine protease [Syntrophobacteria bacterium]